MENCIIKNENGAFYRLGTNYVNAWTNLYGNALLMSEAGAKRIARKTDRALLVIKDYTKINPDGITQGTTVLDLTPVTKCGRVYKSGKGYELHDCTGGKFCRGQCEKSFFNKKIKKAKVI